MIETHVEAWMQTRKVNKAVTTADITKDYLQQEERKEEMAPVVWMKERWESGGEDTLNNKQRSKINITFRGWYQTKQQKRSFY